MFAVLVTPIPPSKLPTVLGDLSGVFISRESKSR